MTIEALKRHMDRRFDRLQRTKVDKTDLVRQLGRFSTKQDLKRFATKQDLKRCATKRDLKRFATKEDLKRFMTRDEFTIHFAAMQRQLESLNDKIDSVLRIVRTQYMHHDTVLTEHNRRITDLEQRP